MTEKRALVLVAGIGRGPFEALAPVLDRQKLEVVKVASPEMSVELARSEPFDLVIFDSEVNEGTLEQVVDEIRHGMSASRNTSLLVLARPQTADSARELIGRGGEVIVCPACMEAAGVTADALAPGITLASREALFGRLGPDAVVFSY